MSGWWICPGNGQVCVDDCVMQPIDCSSVDPNIYLVRWWGTSGEILFNHDNRLPVRQPFTDLTPLIDLFNKWMAAAEFSPPEPSPPITLAQAKQVKSSMVNALFASKRQMPVPAYGYTWDASDNATSSMSDEIAALSGTDAINSAVGALASSVNTALGALTQSANNSIQDLATKTNTFSLSSDGARSADTFNLNDSLNNQATSHNANVTGANTNFGALSSFNIPDTGGALPVMGSLGGILVPSQTHTPVGGGITALGVTPPSVSATPATGPPISWPPIGGAPVSLTYEQFTGLLKVITSRRNTLQQTRTTHKNNIAGLASVDAVVAYDITGGW